MSSGSKSKSFELSKVKPQIQRLIVYGFCCLFVCLLEFILQRSKKTRMRKKINLLISLKKNSRKHSRKLFKFFVSFPIKIHIWPNSPVFTRSFWLLHGHHGWYFTLAKVSNSVTHATFMGFEVNEKSFFYGWHPQSPPWMICMRLAICECFPFQLRITFTKGSSISFNNFEYW